MLLESLYHPDEQMRYVLSDRQVGARTRRDLGFRYALRLDEPSHLAALHPNF